MIKLPGLLSMLLTLWLPGSVASAQSGNDKVQVSTIADVSAVQPGKPFWVGFKFTIEPGWHIYWKNPGDSGLATQVKLTLPDGFTAGELQFPIPQRLVQPGDVVNYGYENEVMLLVQITPKKDLPATGLVKIGAKATWLVCKEDCMPGGSPVSIELPKADSAAAANAEIFKQWTACLPVKEDADDVSSSTAAAALVEGNGKATIQIDWKKVIIDVHFIPGVMHTGDIADLKAEIVHNPITGNSTSAITFNVKNKKDAAPITGLITYTKPDGVKAALEISIPPDSPAKTGVKNEMFDGK